MWRRDILNISKFIFTDTDENLIEIDQMNLDTINK
jgi:hypothetical protein